MPLSLREFPALKDLSAQEIQTIAPLFTPWNSKIETLAIKQGQPANYLYLLAEGEISLLYKPYDGEIMTLSKLEPGNVFGWSAVLGNGIYSSSALCRTDCRGFSLASRDLRQFIKSNPGLGYELLNALAQAVSSRWQDAEAQVKYMFKFKNEGKTR
jgi:CRP-like cAMP-binding protein